MCVFVNHPEEQFGDSVSFLGREQFEVVQSLQDNTKSHSMFQYFLACRLNVCNVVWVLHSCSRLTVNELIVPDYSGTPICEPC